MNIADLIQSYFDGDNAQRLGQAVGIDGNLAQKALSIGLPMQVNALADHAANPQGQSQIMEAISSLPQFGSIADVLGSADGAGNLQRAGELLAPALLGGKADSIVNTVTSQVGGSVGGVQKLLHMALPLLLSLLGRQGVNAGSLGSVLGGLKNMGNPGSLAGVAAGAAGLAGAAQAAGGNLPGAGGEGTVNAILDLLKAQLSGANADKIGGAAGFTGSTAGRAVQGAWPVVLSALVNKGRSDAGAGDLLHERCRHRQAISRSGGARGYCYEAYWAVLAPLSSGEEGSERRRLRPQPRRIATRRRSRSQARADAKPLRP